MSDSHAAQLLFFTGILLLVLGLLTRRLYDRKACLLSMTIVSGYYVLVLILEQITMATGTTPMLTYYLFVPTEAFSLFINSLLSVLRIPYSIFVHLPLTIASPYLLLLFTKRSSPKDQSQQSTFQS